MVFFKEFSYDSSRHFLNFISISKFFVSFVSYLLWCVKLLAFPKERVVGKFNSPRMLFLFATQRQFPPVLQDKFKKGKLTLR